MTDADKRALLKLAGGDSASRATTDDLQGLLLQVSLALLMVFMIAYFIFVGNAKKEQEEQIIDLNRQKLLLALDQVAENHRVRYGLNALMTQGVDGRRTFDADEHVKGGRLDLAPAAKAAFASGSRAAAADYRAPGALAADWTTNVLAAAGLVREKLSADELDWLDGEIARNVEEVRLDARGVQRALAARLQRQWIDDPEAFKDVSDAGRIADLLRTKSLKLVADESGAEVLP